MIFTREGFRALRFIYGVTVAGLAVAVFLALGSYWYWQSETTSDLQSQRSLRDLQGRVSGLRREREDLRNSDTTYMMMVSRGTFAAEQRLDLVEAFDALRVRHKLASLEYEVAPQRVLRMAGGQSFPAVEVLGSRIKLKFRAYHDGDLMAFLDEFPRMQRGFFPLERCAIKRTLDPARGAVVGPQNSRGGGKPGASAAESEDVPSREAAPTLEAECIADWVTLMDKAKPHQAKNEQPFVGRL
jgi:hypothetical protein